MKHKKRLLGKLSQYRIERDYTWEHLGVLCDTEGTTLFHAIRRGNITDRLAARIVRKVGHLPYFRDFRTTKGATSAKTRRR